MSPAEGVCRVHAGSWTMPNDEFDVMNTAATSQISLTAALIKGSCAAPEFAAATVAALSE